MYTNKSLDILIILYITNLKTQRLINFLKLYVVSNYFDVIILMVFLQIS